LGACCGYRAVPVVRGHGVQGTPYRLCCRAVAGSCDVDSCLVISQRSWSRDRGASCVSKGPQVPHIRPYCRTLVAEMQRKSSSAGFRWLSGAFFGVVCVQCHAWVENPAYLLNSWGPAFFAFRRQHDPKARRCLHNDGIAHAAGLLRRSGCSPAEPYPRQQRNPRPCNPYRQQETSRPSLSCCWPKATNAGGLGAASPTRVRTSKTDRPCVSRRAVSPSPQSRDEPKKRAASEACSPFSALLSFGPRGHR